MSFKCPANIISGKNPSNYNRLIKNATISVFDPNMTVDGVKSISKYINGVDVDQSGANADVSAENLPGFLQNPSSFPSSITSNPSTYNPDELKAIIKGLTRKIAVCSTAYKSTESYTIVSKLKEYFTGSPFVTIFYGMSYLIIAYLGYSYITNKLFNTDPEAGKTVVKILSHKGDKSTVSSLYKFLIFCIPVAMIALMITNKINVAFNSSRVLLLFSLASLVLIGFLKTVASKSAGWYALVMILVLVSAFIGGWQTYELSGEVAVDNQEGEKEDAFDLNILAIVFIALIMLFGLFLLNKSMFGGGVVISICMVVLAIILTYSSKHYRNKRAVFSICCILAPFLIAFGWKFGTYRGAGIHRDISFGVATYVGAKMAIFAGLLGLAIYQAFKAGAEIKRAKKLETNTSKSPYYDVTKPINGLMIVYYIILGLTAGVIVLSAVSQFFILKSLNSLPGKQANLAALLPNSPDRAKIQAEIDNINSAKTGGFKVLDWSYIISVCLIMSIVLSYNGVFSIWIPFVLIPVGLLERGVVTTVLNVVSGNISEELGNWQPVGAYLIEALIKMFTYTPLSDAHAQAAGETNSSTAPSTVSFVDAIGELNSVMFDRK